MRIQLIALFAASAFIAGCASVPGPRESASPPRLVLKDGFPVWDNPANFGPVPANLAATAAATCSTLNTGNAVFEPLGYHSRAQGTNGQALAGGGYYCVRQLLR